MVSPTSQRLTTFAVTAVMSVFAGTAIAETTLDGEALKSAVSGKTVRLETAVGAIPISFRADGTMTGRSADMANYLGRSFDTGTWWIADNQLCQKWKMWMDAKSYCFTLRQAGQKVHWTRDDGLKGVIVVSN